MTGLKELMNLNGRMILITGATGELGKIFAQTLAEMGADLLLVDLPGSNYKEITEELMDTWGITAQGFDCDLEMQQERGKLIKFVKEQTSSLDVLINNAAFVGTAGLKGWTTDFEEQSVETWRRAIEVNLTAAFDLCKGLAPLLKKSNGGCIINISSIYGIHGPDYELYKDTVMGSPAAYAASKGGLTQLTRWLSTTLAPDVRVNTISPGGVFRNQPAEFVKRYEARTPLQRMATEDDFRGAIAYLASDLSNYVTGHDLVIDGGWGVW